MTLRRVRPHPIPEVSVPWDDQLDAERGRLQGMPEREAAEREERLPGRPTRESRLRQTWRRSATNHDRPR